MIKNGIAFEAPEKSSSSEKVIVFDNERERLIDEITKNVLSRIAFTLDINRIVQQLNSAINNIIKK